MPLADVSPGFSKVCLELFDSLPRRRSREGRWNLLTKRVRREGSGNHLRSEVDGSIMEPEGLTLLDVNIDIDIYIYIYIYYIYLDLILNERIQGLR